MQFFFQLEPQAEGKFTFACQVPHVLGPLGCTVLLPVSPFHVHWKDPQGWSTIYFLTLSKNTLKRVNYLTSLRLCLLIKKLGNSFLQQKLFISWYLLGALWPSAGDRLVKKLRPGPCPFKVEISWNKGFGLYNSKCLPGLQRHQLICPSLSHKTSVISI